jgi:phospholipid-binding lipoprotein MlaA
MPPTAENKEAVQEWEQANDPGEPSNRGVFEVNQAIDHSVIKPAAEGYREYIPEVIRKGVRNFLTNMSEPWSFVNEVLQGEMERSGVTLGRFVVNTTLGLLGTVDLMEERLGAHHEEDFGQTLAVWGVGEGPYVMLPLFGPSNPRDAVGTAVGFVFDPANWALGIVAPAYAMASKTVVGGVDKREQYLDPMNDVEKASLDYYASLRSLYRQRRAELVRNGKPSPNSISPGFTLDEKGAPENAGAPTASVDQADAAGVIKEINHQE